jgi:hypothetical protein
MHGEVGSSAKVNFHVHKITICGQNGPASRIIHELKQTFDPTNFLCMEAKLITRLVSPKASNTIGKLRIPSI